MKVRVLEVQGVRDQVEVIRGDSSTRIASERYTLWYNFDLGVYERQFFQHRAHVVSGTTLALVWCTAIVKVGSCFVELLFEGGSRRPLEFSNILTLPPYMPTFSSSGRYLVGSGENTLRVWEVSSGRLWTLGPANARVPGSGWSDWRVQGETLCVTSGGGTAGSGTASLKRRLRLPDLRPLPGSC